jgi:hypothetical protein
MGLKDLAGQAVQAQKDMNQRLKEQRAEAAVHAEEVSTDPQYHMEVNKGSVNMSRQTQRLNQMWHSGWALHTVYSQDGNTIFVYERRN